MKRNVEKMENIKTSVLAELELGYDTYVDFADCLVMWEESVDEEEYEKKLKSYLKQN